MDPKQVAEILKTCESIGFADGETKYIAEPDWEVCVKDLILYLRRDDDDHSIRRLLGQTQVLGRDLLPLFKHYHKDENIWEVALRLLQNLTHPALLLYQEEIPKNKTYLNYYNILEGHLRKYKAAFVDKVIWKALAEKLRELLNMDFDKRRDSHRLTIERILVLVRNILHVPADPAEERRADDDTNLHDQILMVMHISGFSELLLYMASSDDSHEFHILVLEIMFWMLREQTGEQLAKTLLARNEDDKVKDERELIRMREKEAVLNSIQLQKLPTRHSRFGGTFVVRDMKAPSGKDILCHKPITSVADLSLDSLKKRKKVAKNRRTINEEEGTRRSTIPIRIILKEFCASFLDGKYNKLIAIVRDGINRGKVDDNDETYYLWALKFFMEFNRHHQFSHSNVSETISTHTFHYVQTLLDRYQGMMVTDKEKIPFWSRRSHMSLKAYQELLFTLMWMDKDEDESVQRSSRAIKKNVFYLPEYRELLLGLLNTYDPVKLSKLYLKDLIETNHLFLKMLEAYSSQNRRIMVKCKGKKRKSKKESKKRKKARKGSSLAAVMSSSELEEAWDKASGEISLALLSSELPDSETGEDAPSISANVIPFDAASDVPIDEQKGTAVERIAVFLHTGKFTEAVMLLRASREVWPTDMEFFGKIDCDPTDEEELLKSVFMEKASLAVVREARSAAKNGTDENNGDLGANDGPLDEKERERAAMIGDENDPEQEEDEDEEDEEDDEEEQRAVEKEQEFDFRGFVLKYALARVVCNYALLFQDWDTLKPLTLHCILKMFHRFVFDMEYPALICQASLFLTFKKILQVADHRSDLREAKQFFVHFWSKFAKLCEDKRMFIEILFWKTAREAQEIQDGYAELCGEASGKTKKKSDWTKDEERELELLVELYQDSPDEVKKAQKLIEYIMERWTGRPRSKRMFINRLVEKELVDPKEFEKKKRAPKTWSDEEVEKLRELYEEYKDAEDIMGSILDKMELKRSRKVVVQKMIEIDLIGSKFDVKKKGKRSRKSKSQISQDMDSDIENEEPRREESNRNSGSGSDSSSSSDDSSSDSEAENEAAKSDGGNDGPIGPYDEERVMNLGKELMKKDMMVAIRWVKQSLKYYLEDIIDDPDSDESVPLVPIDAECIMAIGNSDFKLFLKQLGVQPPGVQETYWRIPSYFRKRDVELRLETLEKTLNLNEENDAATNDTLEKAGENGTHHENETRASSAKRNADSDSSDSDDESIANVKNQKKRIVAMDSSDDEGETVPRPSPSVATNDDISLDGSIANVKSQKKKRVAMDSSDDDGDTVPRSSPSVVTNDDVSMDGSSTNVKSQKKRRVALDSSDDESETVPQPSPSIATNDDISLGSDVSNAKSSPSKKPVLDSDSDSEDEGNDFGVGAKKKRAFIIDSDSE